MNKKPGSWSWKTPLRWLAAFALLSQLTVSGQAPVSNASRLEAPAGRPLTNTAVTDAVRQLLERSLRSTNAPASNTVAVPDYAGIVPTQYVLTAGDVLDLRVFQEDALNARARVGEDGTVLLPLLGAVKVGGLTLEQARLHIHALLEKDYLVHPQVLLTVGEFAKRRFALLGQVQQPGFYNIPENEKLNLLQAISMAGGYTRLANPSRILIKRIVNGRETIKQVDARAMTSSKNTKVEEVWPEDTIFIGERTF